MFAVCSWHIGPNPRSGSASDEGSKGSSRGPSDEYQHPPARLSKSLSTHVDILLQVCPYIQCAQCDNCTSCLHTMCCCKHSQASSFGPMWHKPAAWCCRTLTVLESCCCASTYMHSGACFTARENVRVHACYTHFFSRPQAMLSRIH